MKYVTPEYGVPEEGPETPSAGPKTDADRVLELASLLADHHMDFSAGPFVIGCGCGKSLPTETAYQTHVAEVIVAAGWVAPGDLQMVIDQIAVSVQAQVDRRAAAETKVDELLEWKEQALATLVKPRTWFYRPGSWLALFPIAFGNDEWCRRTVVVGNRWTGCIVIALWQLNDPECPDCVQRQAASDG